jgi:hypothetical protein
MTLFTAVSLRAKAERNRPVVFGVRGTPNSPANKAVPRHAREPGMVNQPIKNYG